MKEIYDNNFQFAMSHKDDQSAYSLVTPMLLKLYLKLKAQRPKV